MCACVHQSPPHPPVAAACLVLRQYEAPVQLLVQLGHAVLRIAARLLHWLCTGARDAHRSSLTLRAGRRNRHSLDLRAVAAMESIKVMVVGDSGVGKVGSWRRCYGARRRVQWAGWDRIAALLPPFRLVFAHECPTRHCATLPPWQQRTGIGGRRQRR